MNVIIGYIVGYKVSGVFIWVAVYFIARALCKKWDEHNKKQSNAVGKNDVNINAITIGKKETVNNGTDKNINDKGIKYCRKCGSNLTKDASFCQKCGTKIVKE